MILSFHPSHPRFVDLIRSGHKIHSIRRDPNRRWKPGMKIHYWYGSPRNPSVEPYQFHTGICTGVEDIVIHHAPYGKMEIVVELDHLLSEKDIEILAENDGLVTRTFRQWFVPGMGDTFRGRIVHWTDHRYAVSTSPKIDTI